MDLKANNAVMQFCNWKEISGKKKRKHVENGMQTWNKSLKWKLYETSDYQL